MARQLVFDHPEDFLEELRALLAGGVPAERLEVRTPFHVEETEELLGGRPSRVGYFALLGALGGFGGGFAFAALTALDWPIITGGKPIVSVPPFLLIGYLMTILFGSLLSFAGFLLLSRLPDTGCMERGAEFDHRFIILVHDEVPA